jgi:hypothetical protein
MLNHEDHCRTVALIRGLEADNAQLRAQLAQLQKAVRLLLESEDGGGRLSHNIGVPCGLCEVHAQIKTALADLDDVQCPGCGWERGAHAPLCPRHPAALPDTPK